MSDYYMSEGPGYADDSDEIGLTTAVEQTTGNKNTFFSGALRRVSTPTYQWVIVVGAVVALWALGYGLRSDIKIG